MCKNNPTSRLLLTLFLILFIISICFTGYAGNLVKNYHFNSPQIISSGNYTEIIFNGAVNYGIPGKPILPVFPVMLLLPPEETAIDIPAISGDIEPEIDRMIPGSGGRDREFELSQRQSRTAQFIDRRISQTRLSN